MQGCSSHTYRAGPPPSLGLCMHGWEGAGKGLSESVGLRRGLWGKRRLAAWASLARLSSHQGFGCQSYTQVDLRGGKHGDTPPVCISAPLPWCLEEQSGSICASHSTSPLPDRGPEGLRSICDTAQKKVLCFPLTVLPGVGGTLATAHAIAGEEQKALSQARPCCMLSLPMSPAAPFCVCPGPHLEAAQTN